MTEEEQSRVMGDVVFALAKAKQLRSCLAAKFDKMLEDVWNIRMYMAGNMKGRFENGEFHIEGHDPCRMPSGEEIGEIMDQIKGTAEKIEKLEGRLRGIGA